ncbi:hypothetical protein M193_gp011 [Halorubrum tailed phage 7]|uniref:Uncharacterized protein n=1 Tax=Halorubrum sodomense tailed virus 2 TaxID=1262527 RepID=L7TJY8_9CAUD|nr:hypothetical protein HSTV2_11 [Halorubrum sodomense tailed virus 2]YP_008059995.1 hypothetical protein M193_gp011 [Halorubrum tailed phage 7]UBF22159.1 hypothetical protein HRTV-2_gp11 [Halorubrum virus HRTV-2]UBF22268.1 hypothetical protein HRTV-11_gp11 [Halorubrum virus HRTV-11]AGC34280.1 hypothetical protein HSTV2_11 [Halorubrum sodomense tailed virus 2]AGM10883.1 hypothetical protein HRTV7_11 [Halorubrum tailed phage 7]
MNFNKVNYDGDLGDADEEALRSLVSDFEKAQEANVAEFEAAKEQMSEVLGDEASFEDIFGEVQDFADAKDELIAEISEFESFEASPVSEDDLGDASFSRVREYHAYFAELDAADEADEGEEKEFEDMGRRGETHTDEDGDMAFARKHLAGMPGFNKE